MRNTTALIGVLASLFALASSTCENYSDTKLTAMAVLYLDSNKPAGFVMFQQLAAECDTSIIVALEGLNNTLGPFPYHIHLNSLPNTYPLLDGACGAAGGHYDPQGLETPSNGTYTCDPQNPGTTCSIGDLSGKHGSLKNLPMMETYTDKYVQLYGEHSVIGRSIVVHRADKSRYLCAPIHLIPDLNVASLSTAINGTSVKGTFNIIQLLKNPATEAYVTVDVSSTDGTTTSGHLWHVHQDQIPDWGTCTDTHGHFNPLNVTGAGCSTAYAEQKNCELGDLAGKLGTLTISPSTTNMSVGVDSNMALTGPNSIEFKSIVVHAADGGGERIACGNLVNDNDCTGDGLLVRAIFPSDDPVVHGSVEFSQARLGCPTRVMVILDGTGITGNKFHVHTYATTNATRSGGHFDPFSREMDPNYLTQCTPDTPYMCSVGDLSGKFGLAYPGVVTTHTDNNLPLFGMYSILGRSVVVHDATTGAKLRSAKIVWESTTAQGTFSEVPELKVQFPDNSPVQGWLAISSFTNSNQSFIYGDLSVPGATTNQQFSYKMYTNAPGQPNNCTNLGSIYNPTDISGNGCLIGTQQFCKLGDLSGKNEFLELTADPTLIFSTDVTLSLDTLGQSVGVVNDGSNEIVACAAIVTVTASASPSPTIPASPSPTPAAAASASKDNSAGRVTVTTLVPMVLVLGCFGLYLWDSHNRQANANTGSYRNVLGIVLWVVGLLQFALGASSLGYHHNGFSPFDDSYAQFSVSVGILVWIYVTLALLYELMNKKCLPSEVMIGLEGATALMSFVAAIMLSVHFDGEEDYCAYSGSDKTRCTTFQAMIFFTWVLFYVSCCKMYMTSRPSESTKDAPRINVGAGMSLDADYENLPGQGPPRSRVSEAHASKQTSPMPSAPAAFHDDDSQAPLASSSAKDNNDD